MKNTTQPGDAGDERHNQRGGHEQCEAAPARPSLPDEGSRREPH